MWTSALRFLHFSCPWDVFTPLLKSIYGEANWLDMMWMDIPGFYMLSQLMMSFKSIMRSENCLHSSETGLNWGTFSGTLRSRGDVPQYKKKKKSAALWVPKSTEASILLKDLEGPWLRAGWAFRGKRIFVRDVTRKPMVALAELQKACVQMVEGSRKFVVAAIKPWLMECCTVAWKKQLLKKSWQRNTQRTIKLWEPGLLGLRRQTLIFVASILMIIFGGKSKTASSAAQQHLFDEARWWQQH